MTEWPPAKEGQLFNGEECSYIEKQSEYAKAFQEKLWRDMEKPYHDHFMSWWLEFTEWQLGEEP